MIRRLHKPHAGRVARRGSLHHRLHQAAPDRAVLHRGVDGYRPDAGDRIALVEKIAADDLAVEFGDHFVEARMRHQEGKDRDGVFGTGKVGRKVVFLGDRFECVVSDPAADLRIIRPAFPQFNIHGALLLDARSQRGSFSRAVSRYPPKGNRPLPAG